MPVLSFDIGFNEAEIKAKGISQRDGKISRCAEEGRKRCSFLHRTGKRFLAHRRLDILSAKTWQLKERLIQI